MAKRTLAQFRAEQNIWRRDLAELLSVSEAEIERLEMTGEVPDDAAQKIIETYHLPDDYFTVDIDALHAAARAAARKTPKKPVLYLMKIVLIWWLLVFAVQTALNTPASIAAALGASIPALYYTVSDVCWTVITICSGIFLGSYLIKNTNFRGRVADFEFLYPFVADSVVSWVILPFTVKTVQAGIDSAWFITEAAVSLVLMIIDFFFLAFFLNAAAQADTEKGRKTLRILFSAVLAGQLLHHILWVALGFYAEATVFARVNILIRTVFEILIFFGAAFGIYKQPKLKTLWLTILPIAYFAIPEVISVFGQVVQA